MAKDGTNRGGRRVRAGDKPMPIAEKLQKGQAVQLMENDIPVLTSAELEAVDLPEGAVVEGTDMPKPADYLSAQQKNGVPLGADEIYKETWLWLKERGCERLVNPRLIEAYAQAFARYIQCEEATSTYGLLGNHPTSKPLDLLSYPIGNSTQENGVVIDTFGGSGSTMMACEQMNRICYMMELDEKYASVILRRYVENTNNAEGVFVERNGIKIPYTELVKEVERE